ncbi:glutathione S-transferase N-terminal domain-containing protein [Haloprofundus marisrubri]|uniref:glutathione S-transferase N-terminal domain-containing protein n=1 Tax=Haloprofundus marisrubri TaxID=1514971 RepID=UPI0008F89DA0|nr:glutathione S-transferase N-terminal domain-containing protein [Haloprofundus marisrubri]
MLELYQAEGCPHCATVRDELSTLGLSYVSHTPRLPGGEGGDVVNRQAYDQMVTLGGADQIPFLVDHAEAVRLYESDAMVAYLREQYGPDTRAEFETRDPDPTHLRSRVVSVGRRLLQALG